MPIPPSSDTWPADRRSVGDARGAADDSRKRGRRAQRDRDDRAGDRAARARARRRLRQSRAAPLPDRRLPRARRGAGRLRFRRAVLRSAGRRARRGGGDVPAVRPRHALLARAHPSGMEGHLRLRRAADGGGGRRVRGGGLRARPARARGGDRRLRAGAQFDRGGARRAARARPGRLPGRPQRAGDPNLSGHRGDRAARRRGHAGGRRLDGRAARPSGAEGGGGVRGSGAVRAASSPIACSARSRASAVRR